MHFLVRFISVFVEFSVTVSSSLGIFCSSLGISVLARFSPLPSVGLVLVGTVLDGVVSLILSSDVASFDSISSTFLSTHPSASPFALILYFVLV